MSKPAVKSASTRKVSAKKTAKASATASAPAAEQPRATKNILTAGIKALTNAHEEAVARQSRVFESLLGLGQRREAEKAAMPSSATTLDPFGFKKFEDVFDQRVAKAMEHIGVPTADSFAALKAEVEQLRETVARLEAQGRKR